MFIKKFNVKNFKAFKNLTLHFNEDVNVLTGKNNTGKTTVLEALSLWHECFGKLINKARRAEKKVGYHAGDWILGPSYNRYFPFDEINSVRSPYFEDIFHRRNRKNKIELAATIFNGESNEEIEIRFQIDSSGLNYKIALLNYHGFDYKKMNSIFKRLPNPIGKYYASPVAVILQKEEFATDPQIKDAILNRESAKILRNRLYKLLKFPDKEYTNGFLTDLSFILGQNIKLISRSNVKKDKQVIINFKSGDRDIEKDIALVGSGTLQIIEILLNVYQPDDKMNNIELFLAGKPINDFNILLLDEPDSHIHRDIQQRLIYVLANFSKNNQIFISTHNEALIRGSEYNHLFHLDGKETSVVKSIDKEEVEKLTPHFKGLFPSLINPIIRSIGSVSGLDFVNAMEAEQLFFVEGEDDARVINLLLKQKTPPSKKKYMFWVLGGISSALENINSYKTVFSAIKNEKTLWEKSIFIFDKDDLSIEHKELFCQKFSEKINLKAFSWNSYTFESTLFTDLDKLSILLSRWANNKVPEKIEFDTVREKLYIEYENHKTIIEQRFSEEFYKSAFYRYKDIAITKAKKVFGKKVPISDGDITVYIQEYHKSVLETNQHYQLMKKEDVEIIINNVFKDVDLSFSVETDFFDLIKIIDKSVWFDEWNFLLNF